MIKRDERKWVGWPASWLLLASAACVGPLPIQQNNENGAGGDGGTAPAAGGRLGSGGTGFGGSGGAIFVGLGGNGAMGPVGGNGAMGTAGTPALTPDEMAQAMALTPLPGLPKDATNKYADDPRAAVLGQRLFFDRSYSGPMPMSGIPGPGQIACVSCHAGRGLADPGPELAKAMSGPYAKKRNALGLINASYYHWVNWGGRFSAQWELPLAVAENPNIMNSDRLQIAHLLYVKYRTDYEAIFGALDPALGSDTFRFPPSGKPKAAATVDGPWEFMTDADRNTVNRIFVNYGKSIAAYLRKLVSRTSRFDTFMAGDKASLGGQEILGLKVFLGKGRCTDCHRGPNFTDEDFHNLGMVGMPLPMPDMGRFDDIPPLLASPFNSDGDFSDDRTTGRLKGLTAPPPPTTMAQFRTPSLRNVLVTAPYMHSGIISSLADAVLFHNMGGGPPAVGMKDGLIVPLGLTPDEQAALTAFMGALTGDPPSPDLLQDTSR